jgi:hypothetical protein
MTGDTPADDSTADADDTPDHVPVACPQCGTHKVVDWSESADVIHEHNDSRHDGETVAGVVVQTTDGKRVLPHPDDVSEFLSGGSNE